MDLDPADVTRQLVARMHEVMEELWVETAGSFELLQNVLESLLDPPDDGAVDGTAERLAPLYAAQSVAAGLVSRSLRS